jgi:hypothetical protein
MLDGCSADAQLTTDNDSSNGSKTRGNGIEAVTKASWVVKI